MGGEEMKKLGWRRSRIQSRWFASAVSSTYIMCTYILQTYVVCMYVLHTVWSEILAGNLFWWIGGFESNPPIFHPPNNFTV